MMSKLFIIFLILISLTAGCNRYDDNSIEGENIKPISPFSAEVYEKINLYFPNEDMTSLKKESRVIKAEKNKLNNIIINELIKGSNNFERRSIIPKDTKLLSLDVVNSIAYVSFSKELILQKYSEIEEAFILYSIVNTLTEREDINKVQILIEGEIKDLLYKRYSISYPQEYSSIIVDKTYQSPIYVILQYYEALASNNYEDILILFGEDKRDIQRRFFIPSYKELQSNVYNYEINNYLFTKYDEEIIVTIHSTIYYNKDKMKEDQTRYFGLSYEKGRYKIDSISSHYIFE